jgi:hypothetical protein
VDGVITVTFPPTSPPSAGPGMQIGDVLIATHDPLRPTLMGSGIDLNTDAAPDGADLAGGRWCIAAARDSVFSNALVFGNRAGNTAANVSNYIALYYSTVPAVLNGYALCPPAAGSPVLKQPRAPQRLAAAVGRDQRQGHQCLARLYRTRAARGARRMG